MAVKCQAHPRYKGERKPRASCAKCWAIYLGMCETCEACGCQCSDGQGDDDPDGYVLSITEHGTRRIR